jgi:toluene monooxygenase system ferredoxin subunit
VHLDGGTIKAFQGMCPHQEVLLADGSWDPDTNVLVCPGHHWEFDLATGKGLNPVGCQLYEFAVQVVSDEILVAVPDDGQRHHNRFQT